jgi:hypothetical protein
MRRRGIAFTLAIALSGCSSWYQPHYTTIRLSPPPGVKMAAGAMPAQVTLFSQWVDIWTAVCGAVVQYSDGTPQQTIAGNCQTPLTMIAGSPMNIGLAGVLVNHPW